MPYILLCTSNNFNKNKFKKKLLKLQIKKEINFARMIINNNPQNHKIYELEELIDEILFHSNYLKNKINNNDSKKELEMILSKLKNKLKLLEMKLIDLDN